MILKSKPLEIPQDNPFKNDALDMKDSAIALTEFIRSSKDPMVLCIDAPWGQGKTTFLTMWQKHLINEGFSTVYFNAWENDFTDDALISLMGELGTAVETIAKGDHSAVKTSFAKAAELAGSVARVTLPSAIKYATFGALDLDKVSEKVLADLSEKITKDQIERYTESKKSLIEFRQRLAELANQLRGNSENPLVIVIDELDRCRPTFSIELLEKAKHFFNVPNIVFVLGADKEQLGKSLTPIYGGVDANGYLRRFIDFDYMLPSPQRGIFIKSMLARHNFHSLFKERSPRGQNDYNTVESILCELSEVLSLSLREQEHALALLANAVRLSKPNSRFFPVLLSIFIVVKIRWPELYRRIISSEVSPSEILEKLDETENGKAFLKGKYGDGIEPYIVACSVTRNTQMNVIKKLTDSLNNRAEGDNGGRATFALKLIQENDIDAWELLGLTIGKLEIASRFREY